MLRRWDAVCVAALLLGCATATHQTPTEPAPAQAAAPPTSSARLLDEKRAEYSVEIERLADPATRADAIVRLEYLFTDVLEDPDADLQSPQVRALIDAMVGPLVKVYVEHEAELDPTTRVRLMMLLSETRDRRIEPAVRKAFESFAERPRTGAQDTDLIHAARAAAELELRSVHEPMLRAFVRFSVSTAGGRAYRDLNEAMLVLADPSWAPTLRKILDAPMPRLRQAADRGAIDAYKDQLFWQVTAAELLGILRDPAAAKPLIRILLDPEKADVASTALLALVKIGDPALALAKELLFAGKSHELVEYTRRRAKEVGANPPRDQRTTAALVLGTIGRREAVSPMLEAIKTTPHATRVVIARELTKLPATPQSKQAFRTVFEATPPDVVVEPGINALQLLAETAAQFGDPEMVDWLLARAAKVKGDPGVRKDVHAALVVTALKLALPEQLAAVEQVATTYATRGEQDLVPIAKRQLDTCGRRVGCYLDELTKPANHTHEQQFAAIKAAYMIAILGDAKTRDDLVTRLNELENPAVSFAATLAVDHLSPDGSFDVAKQVEAIVRRHRDSQRAPLSAPLKQLAYRLRARAR